MKKVLIVDDDPIVRLAHTQMLGDDFSVDSVGSGKETLLYFENQKPDVVFLDVGLPDSSGFDICRKLESNGWLVDTSVIFVSANTDLSTRIEAFNSGADDFITKPLNANDAVAKVQVLVDRKKSNLKMASQLEEAEKTVRDVMSSSNELGIAMRFVERSFSLHTIDLLFREAINVFNSLGVKAVFAIYRQQEVTFYSCDGVIKPIEQELLELLRNKGRFYDFNNRTQINYEHLSILIKNMPLQDKEAYGRLKDLFPAIVGCLDSRVAEIETQNNILFQAQQLIHSFDVIQVTLKTLTESMGVNQKNATERLHKMVHEMDLFISRLGLEEDQEERVIQYIDTAVEESLQLLDAGDRIFEAFEQILGSLKVTVEKQNAVVDAIATRREQSEIINHELDDALF